MVQTQRFYYYYESLEWARSDGMLKSKIWNESLFSEKDHGILSKTGASSERPL